MEATETEKSYKQVSAERIEDLRHRGYKGGYILNHRALITSHKGGGKLLSSAGLSIVMFALWLLSMKWVSVIWGNMLGFWSDVLGMRTYVTMVHYRLGDIFSFSAPYLHVRSSVPDYVELMIGAVITIVAFLLTFFLPRRHLPMIYLIRVVAFFQACAQVFFIFVPRPFPYGASGYIHGVLIAELALIALVPIVLAFTYYIFDYNLIKKLALTLIVMLYMVLLVPLQYAAHAYVMYHSSLLMLPLLFFIFGLPLNVMMFIAFYSWGASWKNTLYKEPAPRGNGFF